MHFSKATKNEKKPKQNTSGIWLSKRMRKYLINTAGITTKFFRLLNQIIFININWKFTKKKIKTIYKNKYIYGMHLYK